MGKTYRYNKHDGNWENGNKASNQRKRKKKAQNKNNVNEDKHDESGVYNMQWRKQAGIRSR